MQYFFLIFFKNIFVDYANIRLGVYNEVYYNKEETNLNEVVIMLQLLLKPDCIVFKNLKYDMMNHLQDLYKLDFIIEGDYYVVYGIPLYLYNLLFKLTCNFDIELS